MTAVRTLAAYGLHEALRRRAFLVVLLLTVAFLALYWLGTSVALREARELGTQGPVAVDVVASATLLGLAMFGTFFLGTVLAVFLTLGAVRGDAERGLLQQLLVRPVGRPTFVLARFAGAAVVCAPYVVVVYAAAVLITHRAGGWWPDRAVLPALELAAAVVVVAALALLGSVFLSATANGIAAFMLFGAGLVAGLLGQIGDAIDFDTLRSVSSTTLWALPFDACYQDVHHGLSAD